MRIALFILLFSFFSAKGQVIDTAIKVLRKENLISTIVSRADFQKNNFLVGNSDADTIDFGTIYRSDAIPLKKEKKSRDFSFVRFSVFSDSDTIFFVNALKIAYSHINDSLRIDTTGLLTKIDTSRLLKFIENHNQKYHSNWELEDFKRQLISDLGPFGFLCGGIVPQLTHSAHLFSTIIRQRDTLQLKNLASSFNAKNRAYGSAGLFFLQLEKVPLSGELLDLIRINSSSNLAISSCYGCEITMEVPVKELLSAEHLKSMYGILARHDLL